MNSLMTSMRAALFLCLPLMLHAQHEPVVPEGLWAVPSHGMLWGVCEFAERFLGVRWLFPGPLGEDVPKQNALRFELKEPIRGQPGFATRSVAYLGESDREIASRYVLVLDWMKRQRLTNALHPFVTGYGHSWDDYIKPADMEAHPEWKSSGGEAVRNGKVKFFCTTAPGLVELFAKRVIETMDRNPKREMSSISPTDGGGFCTCERCQPNCIDTDPHGKSRTTRGDADVLPAVSARSSPASDRGAGWAASCITTTSIRRLNAPKLPDNVSLCWAPLNYYGYGLLKPLYREEFERVMKRWSEITPHLFYHNYSTWMRSFHGAPLPVSLDILKRELPAAAQNITPGEPAWSAPAPGA
jgi:hypothetical protein